MTRRGLYTIGDQATRDWFERQFRIWPQRADPELTTNLELHYWALVEYRQIHGHEPVKSTDFTVAVKVFDRAYGNVPLALKPHPVAVDVRIPSKRQRRRLKGRSQ